MFRNVQGGFPGAEHLDGKTGSDPEQYSCCSCHQLIDLTSGRSNSDDVQTASVGHDHVLLVMLEDLIAHQNFRFLVQSIREQLFYSLLVVKCCPSADQPDRSGSQSLSNRYFEAASFKGLVHQHKYKVFCSEPCLFTGAGIQTGR